MQAKIRSDRTIAFACQFSEIGKLTCNGETRIRLSGFSHSTSCPTKEAVPEGVNTIMTVLALGCR